MLKGPVITIPLFEVPTQKHDPLDKKSRDATYLGNLLLAKKSSTLLNSETIVYPAIQQPLKDPPQDP